MIAKERLQSAENPPPALESVTDLFESQMYDIMKHFKYLLEQNHEQARQVLIDNPALTRMLFQTQIMLGMVKPPQKMPTIHPISSQSQPAQVVQLSNIQTSSQSQPAHVGMQLSNIQTTRSLPAQVGMQGQATLSQSSIPIRQQNLHQDSRPPISFSSASVSSMNYQLHMMKPQPSVPQNKSYMNMEAPILPHPQIAQIHSLSMPPPPHYSARPSHISMAPNQIQQSFQTPGMFNQPTQPHLPQQQRPPMQPFAQLHPQMHHSIGFQHSVAPQQLLPLPLFHPESGITAPSSHPQGQPTLPSQPPPQLYQFSSDMEKALRQQFMSLTPEQINVLPPEKRVQVLQLQEILRQ